MLLLEPQPPRVPSADPSASSTDQVLWIFPLLLNIPPLSWCLKLKTVRTLTWLSPSSPTQTARIATLRTLSLQRLSPDLLLLPILGNPMLPNGLWALEATPSSLASSHVTSSWCQFQEREYSISPSSLAFPLSVFPCMECSFSIGLSCLKLGYVVIIN